MDGGIQAFGKSPRLSACSDETTLLSLRLSHEEISEIYRTKLHEYHEWVAEEARETASRLTGETQA